MSSIDQITQVTDTNMVMQIVTAQEATISKIFQLGMTLHKSYVSLIKIRKFMELTDVFGWGENTMQQHQEYLTACNEICEAFGTRINTPLSESLGFAMNILHNDDTKPLDIDTPELKIYELLQVLCLTDANVQKKHTAFMIQTKHIIDKVTRTKKAKEGTLHET